MHVETLNACLFEQHICFQRLSCDMDPEIPSGLFELLKNVTIAVLRERPNDLNEFIADYFIALRDTQSVEPVPLYVIVEDDYLAREPSRATFLPRTQKQNRSGRRGSVSAEKYDPENDLDADTASDAIYHPKTESQTARLKEAVKDILLFRQVN